MNKILVVGSINMDMVVSVPRIPKEGETLLGHEMEFFPGGKGANQAYAASSLGGETRMIGAIGKDEYGREALNSLKSVGVDTQGIDIKEGPTGLAIIYVDDRSENCIVVIPGANEKVDESSIKDLDYLIKETQWVMLQMEIPLSTVEYTIRQAALYNKRIILNPAPAIDNFPEDLYKYIDIITPNETELELMMGMPVASIDEIGIAAKALKDKGVSQVIVTCGGNGAILVNDEGSYHFPVEQVKVVDTTAAGDTFNAGIAVALSEGKGIKDAIHFANSAANITIQRAGAQSSIPRREEVKIFNNPVFQI